MTKTFDETVDELFRQLTDLDDIVQRKDGKFEVSKHVQNAAIRKAKAALCKAIEEMVIGEDEEDYEDGTPEYLFYASRNGLRASQRQVLNPKRRGVI